MSGNTIAAISTAAGKGAVGIVRLSGEDTMTLVDRLFAAKSGAAVSDWQPGQLVLGTLRAPDGTALDQALCVVRRGPFSYTGEDMAEFHCHGSPTLLLLLLETLVSCGARLAQAGEFTKRAFLNGRLDLAEAEAVGDLIDAASEGGVKNAAAQLGGALSRRIAGIYDPLLTVAAHFHAVLDYPDEDIDAFTVEPLQQALDEAVRQCAALLKSYETGRFHNGGIPCAIVGRPNSGKSSLLNALLGYERAIVTHIAGTTRDTVEEHISLGGVSLRLIDTAGLRESDDLVEQLGVVRSRKAMEGAALILWVLDGTQTLTDEDEAVAAAMPAGVPVLALVNKADLGASVPIEGLPVRSVLISAKEKTGLDELERQITALFPPTEHGELGSVLTNARQFDAASRGMEYLAQAAESLRQGVPPDAVIADLELALEALGELNGTSLREDMTARIFEKFCVGK